MARNYTKVLWDLQTPKGQVTISRTAGQFIVQSDIREGSESLTRRFSTETYILAIWKFREWIDEMQGQVVDEELKLEAERIKT